MRLQREKSRVRIGIGGTRSINDIGLDAALSRGGVGAVPGERLPAKRRRKQHHSNKEFAVHLDFGEVFI
jgi:hypothetical protein